MEDIKYRTLSNAFAGSRLAKLQDTANIYTNKITEERKKIVFKYFILSNTKIKGKIR